MPASSATERPAPASAPPRDARRARAAFIDAARGTAMLFVFLTHFSWIYFEGRDAWGLQGPLLLVGQIASPTFMLISGSMLGFLHHTRGARFAEFRVKLMDRGLVLLTAVHLFETLAYLPKTGSFGEALRWAPITDAIGACLLLGPLLIGHVSPGRRIGLGLSLFTLSWLLVATWHPASPPLRYLKEAMVGPLPTAPTAFGYNFPVLPWFAFYFGASSFGTWLGARFEREDSRAIVHRLLTMAAIGVTSGIAVKVGYEFLARYVVHQRPVFGPVSHLLLSPFQKWPPAPMYFLFYGGIGCAILCGCYLLERHGRAPRLLQVLTLLGQTSLVVFVIQDFVYIALLDRLRPPLTPAWPLLLLGSIVLITAVAHVWLKQGWNRFLTVGLGHRWGRGLVGGESPRAAP